MVKLFRSDWLKFEIEFDRFSCIVFSAFFMLSSSAFWDASTLEMHVAGVYMFYFENETPYSCSACCLTFSWSKGSETSSSWISRKNDSKFISEFAFCYLVSFFKLQLIDGNFLGEICSFSFLKIRLTCSWVAWGLPCDPLVKILYHLLCIWS